MSAGKESWLSGLDDMIIVVFFTLSQDIVSHIIIEYNIITVFPGVSFIQIIQWNDAWNKLNQSK